MISILHPSRSRPDRSFQITQQWLKNAGCEVELILSIDNDDPKRDQYLRAYDSSDLLRTRVISNYNRSAVDAINNAAKEARADIFIVVSDDTECCFDWGNKILNAVIGRKDYVLRVADGIQKWIVTCPIMDREYYNRFGYIYNPDYDHMFADTEMTHVAQLLGKIIRRDDILFRHLHYSKGLAQIDSLNHRNDATITQGCKTYLKRFRECFGLAGVDPWSLPNEAQGHLQWLKDMNA